ncbi:MAG TPA: lysozyme inhibitor LprI family protein [Burkholderiales bacterium]|nr:lysozyme inhibitor LprI family protein [Burkholderiales bacterium]
MKAAATAIAVALSLPAIAMAVTDCSRAKTNFEKLLCSNARLEQADQRLAIAFREALNRGISPELLIDSQRAWMRDSRDICNDVQCMLDAYGARISDLDNQH